MARDPLDDSMTYAIYVMVQEKAKKGPWEVGSYHLEESAYLQGSS
jgi:hypothetical protein